MMQKEGEKSSHNSPSNSKYTVRYKVIHSRGDKYWSKHHTSKYTIAFHKYLGDTEIKEVPEPAIV